VLKEGTPSRKGEREKGVGMRERSGKELQGIEEKGRRERAASQ